jgi:competence protein ComFC
LADQNNLWELLFCKTKGRLCRACQACFTIIPKRQACPGCGLANAGLYCEKCQQRQEECPAKLISNRALFQADEKFAEWLNCLQVKGDLSVAGAISQPLRQVVQQHPGYVCCVLPQDQEIVQARGFNQVEVCLTAAKLSSVQLLNKKKPIINAQKKQAKTLEPSPFFSLTAKAQQLTNKKVLLISDRYTTGATLLAAAICLKAVKPREIRTLTFGR